METTPTKDGDYDMSIHSNPDAQAWAKFFVQTVSSLASKKMSMTVGTNMEEQAGNFALNEEYMHGWFANAMMAMHDHLAPRLIKSIDPDSMEARSVVPEKYRLKLNPRHLGAGFLDIYDILEIAGVEDKELDHAAKKILCSGRRDKGGKQQDVTEAIVALQRYLERNRALFEKDEEDQAIYKQWVSEGLSPNPLRFDYAATDGETPNATSGASLPIGEIAKRLDRDLLKDLTEKSVANLMKPSPLYEMVAEERVRRGEWRGAKRAGMETVGDF